MNLIFNTVSRRSKSGAKILIIPRYCVFFAQKCDEWREFVTEKAVISIFIRKFAAVKIEITYEEICITHGVFAHRYDGCRRKEQKESAAAAKANE